MDNAWGSNQPLIDGRFELVRRLGAGGMGTVWRARDTMLHREVALKEVSARGTAAAYADPAALRVTRERTLREARALARLHHPNVVTIYHIVDSAEFVHPWLVMELVTGGSLADRLKRGPLTLPEAVRVARGVLAALRAAHLAGIMHRDVKPANVLLRPDGSPVLTDFGIAALYDSAGLTATGSLIGSPEFIAPERIRGAEGDPASDLWSLAMMLYIALEGHNPLQRDNPMATLAAVLDGPIPPPTRAGPLGPVLSAMLVRDPAARPNGAQFDQMLAEVEHILADPARMRGPLPAVFHPPSADVRPPWATTVRERASKRRWPVFMAGAVAAALIVLAGVFVWTFHGSPGAPTPNGLRAAGGTQLAGATGGTPAPLTTRTDFALKTQGALLTPAGIRAAIAAFRPLISGTKYKTLAVNTAVIQVQAPTKANPNAYDTYVYYGGSTAADYTRGAALTDDDVLFDPAAIDWDKLPGLLQIAATQLGIKAPTALYLGAVGSLLGATPALVVYAQDAHNNAYMVTDAKGAILMKFPHTD